MARILTSRRIMGSSTTFTERPDWGTAVVLDPRELSRLENANARLRASHRRRTLAAAVFFVGSVASTLTACWERLCLTSVSGTMAAAVGRCEQQDCGGAIKGFRLDVLTGSQRDALAFGRQDRFAIVIPGEA